MQFQAFASQVDVSRETFERLEIYAALLRKWTRRINLVSPNTLDVLWARHMLDSAQIYELAESQSGCWADLGSGGGFPGLVVAILDTQARRFEEFALVESDQRKAAFLRTAARETGVNVRVIAERAESIPPLGANVLSARALADLSTLLEYAERHVQKDGICLFSKGTRWQDEVEHARAAWSFDVDAITSKTDPDAVVLRIGEIERA